MIVLAAVVVIVFIVVVGFKVSAAVVRELDHHPGSSIRNRGECHFCNNICTTS